MNSSFIPPQTVGLLFWWQEPANQMDIPWRSGDAYHAFLGGMLMDACHPRLLGDFIWRPLVGAWPTPESLASSCVSKLQRCLRPAGLEDKALVLITAAKDMCDRFGGIPSSEENLRTIQGITPLACSTIRIFGFDHHDILLNNSVKRLIRRLFGIPQEEIMYKLGKALIPPDFSPVANMALHDFSAQICRLSPACKKCPIKKLCTKGGKTA